MPKKPEDTKADTSTEKHTGISRESDLSAVAWMGTTWVEAMSDLGSELASFIAERIREDVKTQHEILHCKSLSEMQAIQAAFMERAYVQYTVETGKLLEKSTSLFPQLAGKTKHTPV